jgi:hypothetical protein
MSRIQIRRVSTGGRSAAAAGPPARSEITSAAQSEAERVMAGEHTPRTRAPDPENPRACGVISCDAMWRRLGIQRGERTLFAWGAACLLLLGFADASVRNASETLFVKRVGPGVLPIAILLSSLVLVATTSLVARLAARPDRTRLLPALLVILAGTLVPLWLLIHGDVGTSARAGAAALFIASKELQSLGLLAFLLALGDLVHPRQAKRLLAPLLAALTLGAILGSFASRPLGNALGIAGLLPLAGGLLIASAGCAVPLRRVRPPRLGRGGTRAALAAAAASAATPNGDGKLARLWRESRLFRLLAGVTAANALLAPMLYVQFQFVADLATQGSDGEARLLAINSALRGWISVGILAIQLGFASRLFRRIGLPLSTALSPLFYVLGFLGLTWRVDLAVGMSAMASTRLVDTALFDPALRVLYNLFHERVRPRASALLEGPIKRGAGAAGAAITQGAIAFGGAGVIAFLALPIALLWFAVAAVLWRSYPTLLLQAAGARGRRERLPVRELLDQATGRALARQLASSDPEECRAAIELCCEADPLRAVATLARAARHAPDATRGLLVESLDRLLEEAVADPVGSHAAAQDLAALLAQPERLAGLERANVVQAFGRLAGAGGDGLDPLGLLGREAADPHPAVRLAAEVALARRAGSDEGAPDAALAAATRDGDTETRQIAREELRALLIQGDPEREGERWLSRLRRLAELCERPDERAAACESLADVARRHGARAAEARMALLALWDDPDVRVRAAVLRFAGHAGLHAQARRIVARLDAPEESVAAAAEEALRALGPAATDVLLVELSFGRRSRHEGLFRLLRDLEVEEKTLRTLFERELDAVRRALVQRGALGREHGSPILLQRLDERVEEGVQTALSILGALRSDDALAELSRALRRAHDVRGRAILLEALEALLEPGERAALLPLVDERPLEERAGEAARRLGAAIPPPDVAIQSLLDDADELTRQLARAALRAASGPVAPAAGVGDHARVLDPVEIALYLKKTPLFEGLSTRHLLDLAAMVREERHPAGAVLVGENETGSNLYLIVEGRLRITRGERVVAEIGPEAFLGEVGLLEGARRTATATTVTPIRVLRLERDDLLTLMEEIPAIAIRVAQELSRRYRQVMEQMVE